MVSDQEWSQIPDEEKVQLIQQGDPDLHGYLLIMSRRNVQKKLHGELKTEDNVHEVSMDAYETMTAKIGQYDGKARFSTWCYRIIANKVIDFARKSKKTVWNDDVPDIPDPNNGSETPYRRSVFCHRIWPCWQQIKQNTSPRSRWHLKVWAQLDLKDLSPEEVAQSWDKSRQNINIIAHRVRHKFKVCLQNQGYEDWSDLLSL